MKNTLQTCGLHNLDSRRTGLTDRAPDRPIAVHVGEALERLDCVGPIIHGLQSSEPVSRVLFNVRRKQKRDPRCHTSCAVR